MWERSCRFKCSRRAKERWQVAQTWGRGLSVFGAGKVGGAGLELTVIVEAESSAAGFAGAVPAGAAAAAGDVEVMMEEEREGLAPESFMTMAKPGVVQGEGDNGVLGVVVSAVSRTVG